MNKIICVALLLISIYAKAGSCSANGTGNWETAGTWSCGHVPGAGDNVTIGAGITITVNANNGANIGNLSISGTLKFTNGSKLNLAATSVVNIFLGGSVTGGNGGAKLIFPSSTYSGPFSATGPYYFSNGSSGSGLLPLILISFYSSHQNQDLILHWTTENEENINSFEIESSSNGNAGWQSLQTLPPMATEGGGYSYSFIVAQTKINGDQYFRLKIIDRDGKYVYSKVLSVGSDQPGTISITPTLAFGSVTVSLPASGQTRVSIYNISGQLIKTITTASEAFSLDVSALGRGEYFLQAFQKNNSYTGRFLKQ